MPEFACCHIRSWSQMEKVVTELSNNNSGKEWVYRGQSKDWPLATSLERALKRWGVDPTEAPKVEQKLIREFRRQYRGSDRDLVNSDTLYCLALMQHHGAPTRLLDFTYSPFVAAQVAIKSGVKAARKAVIWCINTDPWCGSATKAIVGARAVWARKTDRLRNDSSFLELYIYNRNKFVFPENALPLNERLIIQQGVFMCPGNATVPFEENLKGMEECYSDKNVLKLRFKMEKDELKKVAMTLRRMNVSEAALFPDLDGFARSLGERLDLLDRKPTPLPPSP